MSSHSAPSPSGMGFREFVAFVAAVMSTNALAIDTMLPALPVIGQALGITDENQRQWILTAYMLGFGGAQIVYGTLADRFGRRPVLLAALGIYASFSAVSGFADSLAVMAAARVLQGVGAAGTRVLAISIIRDCYEGRQMARVMSLAIIVFLVAPVAAPTLGQVIMSVAPWPAIFHALALFGALVGLWAAWHLRETLHEEDRLPIDAGRILAAFKTAASERMAVGYTLAVTLLFGGLIGYINSAQQLFADVFHQARIFPLVFGATAAFMAASALLNSRIVVRLGMHRVSHAALCAYVTVAAVHAAIALSGHESLPVFAACQSLLLFCTGMLGSNFNTLAMEPLGHIAGTASSVQGFVSTVGGALLGFLIGQLFDGTAVPITLGYLVLSSAALCVVAITERGRLFRPTHDPAPAAARA